MAWDKGFNFRSTSGYVTDGTDETYVIGDLYPTTRNSVTFGWSGSVSKLDRTSSSTPEIAGVNFLYGGGVTFRVDLPATGFYVLRLALGDASGGGYILDTKVLDNATTLITFTNTIGNNFIDAVGFDYTTAQWISLNHTVTKNFATTILFISLDKTTDYNPIAHLFVSQFSSTLDITRAAADTNTLSDVASLMLSLLLGSTDTTTLSDAIVAGITSLLDLNDSISIVDDNGNSLAALVGLNDTLTLADALEALIPLGFTANDIINLTDNLRPNLYLLLDYSDSISLQEMVTKTLHNLTQQRIPYHQFIRGLKGIN